MKKTIRPFSVETRRAARKLPGPVATPRSESPEADQQSPAPVTPWPLPDEAETTQARRAADALFARPSAPATPQEAPRPPVLAQTRRVLPTLDEEDHIARLLEEEEARRPRRGRKPAPEDALAPVPQRHVRPSAPETGLALPTRIAGYVRGKIFARYARRDEPGFGQYWRKRPKPAW